MKLVRNKLMNDQVKIRRATKDDLDLLVEFGEELYLVEREFELEMAYSKEESKERYRRQLVNPEAVFLVAEVEGKLVGYVYAHNERAEGVRGGRVVCEMEVVYVEPKYRGRGVAGRLVEECKKWAGSKGVWRMEAVVFEENEASKRALGKMGFEVNSLTYKLDLDQ